MVQWQLYFLNKFNNPNFFFYIFNMCISKTLKLESFNDFSLQKELPRNHFNYFVFYHHPLKLLFMYSKTSQLLYTFGVLRSVKIKWKDERRRAFNRNVYLFIYNYFSTVTSQPKFYVVKVKKKLKRLIFRWPCIKNYVRNLYVQANILKLRIYIYIYIYIYTHTIKSIRITQSI